MKGEVLGSYEKAEDLRPAYGKGTLKFGVELEVEVKRTFSTGILDWWDGRDYDKAADTIHTLLNPPGQEFVITKEDGSLDNGFEIVSAPATWSECVKRWEPLFEPKRLPVTVKKSCGMHVHFSREAIQPKVLEHIVEFITLPKNRKFVVKIAGRNSPEYARLAKKDPSCVHDVNEWDDYWGRPRRSKKGEIEFARYEAVNLTNPKTIEFRLFASTLDRDKFYSRLEFVKATIDFAKRSGEWVPLVDAFIPMVKNSDDYPHLLQFIEDNNLAVDESGADSTIT